MRIDFGFSGGGLLDQVVRQSIRKLLFGFESTLKLQTFHGVVIDTLGQGALSQFRLSKFLNQVRERRFRRQLVGICVEILVCVGQNVCGILDDRIGLFGLGVHI
jgi:hypothetical protein